MMRIHCSLCITTADHGNNTKVLWGYGIGAMSVSEWHNVRSVRMVTDEHHTRAA